MLNNNKYNLMNQLVEEHKSLWRIKNEYMKDGEGDSELEALWEELAKTKEGVVEKLTQALNK